MTDVQQCDRDAADRVTDEQIDALVAKGWDWHSAYLQLMVALHRGDYRSKTDV